MRFNSAKKADILEVERLCLRSGERLRSDRAAGTKLERVSPSRYQNLIRRPAYGVRSILKPSYFVHNHLLPTMMQCNTLFLINMSA
jgi:hypothetical protein